MPRRIQPLVALVLLLALALGGCGSSRVTRRPTAAVSPAPDCPSRVIPHVVVVDRVGRGVGPMLVDGSTVWATRPAGGEVVRVAPGPPLVRRVGGEPVSLASGFGRLWVAERDAGRIVSLDPDTLRGRTSSAVAVPVGVAESSGQMWALSLDQNALVELDATNGVPAQQDASPQTPAIAMLSVGSELWVLGHGLSPFDTALDRVVRFGFAQSGRSLTGLSASGDTIWIAEPSRRSVLRVQTADRVVVRELPAPDGIQPVATAATPCGTWEAGGDGWIVDVDPSTGAALGPPLRVGRSIADLVASGAGVWVSDPLDGTIVHVSG